MDWRLAAALLLAAALILLMLSRKWEAWRRSVRARRRGARAVRGEQAAEALLQHAGYTILNRQLGLTWKIECDGEPLEFLLRADLLVEKDGQEFIAEVKTGEMAPSLTNASTRRQMLEYSIAFDSPTILLVDVERGEILEVSFPLPEARDEELGEELLTPDLSSDLASDDSGATASRQAQ